MRRPPSCTTGETQKSVRMFHLWLAVSLGRAGEVKPDWSEPRRIAEHHIFLGAISLMLKSIRGETYCIAFASRESLTNQIIGEGVARNYTVNVQEVRPKAYSISGCFAAKSEQHRRGELNGRFPSYPLVAEPLKAQHDLQYLFKL